VVVKIGMLLQRFSALTMLCLNNNPLLGPLGARALAVPGLAAAKQLQTLELEMYRLGNDGVSCLVPNGHINRSLTTLNLEGNDIDGAGGICEETVMGLASRCTNLERLEMDDYMFTILGERNDTVLICYWTENTCLQRHLP
jgi:Ran GTPase-activating protein (RanGAP) involved in mRNA processing and transport